MADERTRALGNLKDRHFVPALIGESELDGPRHVRLIVREKWRQTGKTGIGIKIEKRK
ncbi:MAG: hypothetical protein ACXWMV_13010 [Syntrophales bacterium]